MKKAIRYLILFLALALGSSGLSYAEAIDINALVDNFQKATDLQKDQMTKDFQGKEISTGGVAGNAGEYDFFDVTNDIKGIYYQVTLQQQKTKSNIPYQVILLFRDRDRVIDIDRGQEIQKDGQIVRLIDERLQVAVWIFCGEMTEKDKNLFNQSVY